MYVFVTGRTQSDSGCPRSHRPIDFETYCDEFEDSFDCCKIDISSHLFARLRDRAARKMGEEAANADVLVQSDNGDPKLLLQSIFMQSLGWLATGMPASAHPEGNRRTLRRLVNHAQTYNLPLPELETKPKIVVDLRERL